MRNEQPIVCDTREENSLAYTAVALAFEEMRTPYASGRERLDTVSVVWLCIRITKCCGLMAQSQAQ